MDASDGSGQTRIHCGQCPGGSFTAKAMLEWSPGGDKLAFDGSAWDFYFDDEIGDFVYVTQPSDIYVIASDGTDLENLTNSPAEYETSPSWSPNGSQLAFSRLGDIWVMPSAGGAATNVTATPGEAEEYPSWSPDGTKFVFTSTPSGFTANEIYVMNLDGSGRTRLTTDSRGDLQPDWQPLGALDPYPRPGGGSPQRVPLVPSYQQCTAPNSQHVEPLDEPSCEPPALTSQVLTTGTAGRGQGSTRLDVVQGDPATQTDEADVHITARASDVRCKQANAACPAGAGSDFTGKLLLSLSLRITDRASGFGGVSATVSDAKLQAPLTCTASPDATLGATCTTTTSAGALIPGYVTEQKRIVLSSLQVTLDDPGPNGSGYGPACPPTCGDGDEAPYLEQGVFIGL